MSKFISIGNYVVNTDEVILVSYFPEEEQLQITLASAPYFTTKATRIQFNTLLNKLNAVEIPDESDGSIPKFTGTKAPPKN